ncbi:MAG: hypothetical protein K5Q00_05805, partial [Gammaproteobacteria bacterium]|nr:hypothetical protein [Gammaproteobacteria bacterium]
MTQNNWLQTIGLSLQAIPKIERKMVSEVAPWDQIKPIYIMQTVKIHESSSPVPLTKSLNEASLYLSETLLKIDPNFHPPRYPIPPSSPILHLLINDAGMGKSCALRYLNDELQKATKPENPFQRPIPVRIPLTEDFVLNNTDFIYHYFIRELRYSVDALEQIKNEYCFVFLLDGYDQLRFCQGDRAFTKIRLALDYLRDWRALVLISTRATMVTELKDLEPSAHYYLEGAKEDEKIAYLSRSASTYTNPAKAQEHINLIHSNPELWSLLDSPLLLYLISKSLNQLAVSLAQNVNAAPNRYTIYEAFIQRWFIIEYERTLKRVNTQIPVLGENFFNIKDRNTFLRDFAEMIACNMFILNTDKLLDIRAIINALLSRFNITNQQLLPTAINEMHAFLNAIIWEMRDVGPLKITEGRYIFLHPSIQEFLFARRLNDQLALSNDYDTGQFESRFNVIRGQSRTVAGYWTKFRLDSVEYQNVLQFLIEATPAEKRMWELLQLPHGISYGTQATFANLPLASLKGNLTTLYTKCGYSLSNKNLSDNYIRNGSV